MLTLTENASNIVKEITSQTEGDEAGLRITTLTDEEASLGVSTAEGPEPGDQVVEQEGAKVYLDGQAAEVLDDKILDAGIDESGNLQFALGQQA